MTGLNFYFHDLQLTALREDSELQMRDLIRRRMPGRGSCL